MAEGPLSDVAEQPYTIGRPWQDSRGRPSRDGRLPWRVRCVTRDDAGRLVRVEVKEFDTREQADAFREQEIEAGRATPAS